MEERQLPMIECNLPTCSAWRRDGLWVEMTDVVSVSSILARTHPSLDDIFQQFGVMGLQTMASSFQGVMQVVEEVVCLQDSEQFRSTELNRLFFCR